MNAMRVEDDDTLFLSPVNLRKLKEFHGIKDDKGQFVIKRYKKLLELLKEMDSNEFRLDCEWLERKIEAIRLLYL